jgi:hypothetical protein
MHVEGIARGPRVERMVIACCTRTAVSLRFWTHDDVQRGPGSRTACGGESENQTVLQTYDDVLDDEATRRAAFDLQWKSHWVLK